ncbi:SHOCT domain-containing protein [Nonomuraea basaltis]|uniref:SHOCT domain-containing protein n=1 Tax=Nonomuraea basaltis TaxID=2495887 RepID=UPI00110C5A47|nr:SHOCT domain-containing protein [Nonomuraea basaltis]TMR91729.1 SHOCT domain-containing protein [Nonomuraea basaltis]
MNTIAQWAPHWGAGGFWPVFPVFWGLFWIAVVALAVMAWRRGWWGPRRRQTAAAAGTTPTASAEQILAERYARGEMSDDEYLERISVLKGGSS